MKSIRNFFHLILIGLLCQTCIEIIEFDGGETSQVWIFGKFTNSTIYDQAIVVRRTNPDLTGGDAIVTAEVSVEDDLGNAFPYTFDESTGRYLPTTPLVGVPGRSYRALVIFDRQTYTSRFQQMPTGTVVDSTYTRFVKKAGFSDIGVRIDQYHLEVLTDSQLPIQNTPIYLKWDIQQVFVQQEISLPSNNFPFYSPRNCYISETFIGANILLFDGSLVNTSRIEGQVVADVLLDNSFKTLRGYGVVQSSFGREAFEYWQKVDEVSNRVGSIFEVPPAPIPGNFSNVENPEMEVLGFFEVSKVDTTGTVVTEADLPVFLGLNGNFISCEFPINALASVPVNCFECLQQIGVAEGCYNCLSLANSSLLRPSFID